MYLFDYLLHCTIHRFFHETVHRNAQVVAQVLSLWESYEPRRRHVKLKVLGFTERCATVESPHLEIKANTQRASCSMFYTVICRGNGSRGL